ncbi:MAG: hypothetical protein R3195_14550 [Gemmatimonadota bacterium]|nr:hypothetical protein [Gemmatimonadota bacterium]
MRIRLFRELSLLMIALLFGSGSAAGQTADVSGKWNLEVTTGQGITNPSLTLEQDGQDLTGHYSSQTLGEVDFTGTVEGSTVTIAFDARVQGQTIPVVYVGTVKEDGTMSGTIDLAAGAITGTFTATRVDG